MMKPAKTNYHYKAPVSWNELPWGDLFKKALDDHLTEWWSKIFGCYLLKLGHLSAEISTEHCVIPHQYNVAPSGMVQIQAEMNQLPFQHKSIDACLLAHTLSYSNDPHQILREVDRLLRDDGWLIISHFNPFSLLGMGSCIPILQRNYPYNSRMFSLMRIIDWLQLLNYEVVHKSCFQLLPWRYSHHTSFLGTHFPALGCLNLIISRKRVLPLTLNLSRAKKRKPAWKHAVGSAKTGQLETNHVSEPKYPSSSKQG